MDFWQWLSMSVPAGAIINGFGLLSLAALFATDRILTRGQHGRRVADITLAHEKEVADLKAHHAALVAEKDERYAELKASRDYYRTAVDVERGRADKLVDHLGESAELAKLATHLLGSLEEAAKDSTP